MKKAEKKMNNRGFSLILVIVCMTLIGVLASMILSMSVSNVQMRVVEEEASDNFYSAEEVLDEVMANVEKQANEALGDAYTLFLQKYAATAPKNRESVFVNSLSAVLNDLFKKDFVDNYDADAFRTKYLGVADTRTGIEIGKATNVLVENGTETSTITIQGLSVTYTGDDGYKTTIQTDLVLKVTYPKFFEDNAAGPAFLDYAIIADNNVEKTGGETGTIISGCVYSGNDFVVSGGANVTVNSQYLIAKNAINVGDKSELNIAKGSLDQLKYASKTETGIWTKNILLTTSNRIVASNNELEISNMDCYVQDDLTINGIKDTVTIYGGNYYGYGSGLTEDANSNSAINVNAKDINLTLDSLNHLWLAGQSYISVPAGYGRNVTEVETLSAMQGESVSFKGNQAAYLMPGDSIEGVWHNPMTVDEYNAALQLIEGSTTEKSLVLSTRKADSIQGDIMNLDQYLDISSNASAGDYTSRYEPVHVKYQQGGEMVYIYMKFSTPNAAKRYFEEYYNINKDLVDTRMETIGTGSIQIKNISDDKITATGNLVVHSNEATEENPNTIIHSNSVATNAEVREADYRYSGYFRNLTMSLDAGTIYYGSGDNLTDCIFRFDSETMATLLALGNISQNHDGQDYTLYTVDNQGGSTYSIESGNNRGLVIASGNVKVNSSFTGLIIAKGTVTMADNVTIASAPEAMNALIISNENLKSFFKYYDDPNAGEESKEAIDIYYNNWHKN